MTHFMSNLRPILCIAKIDLNWAKILNLNESNCWQIVVRRLGSWLASLWPALTFRAHIRFCRSNAISKLEVKIKSFIDYRSSFLNVKTPGKLRKYRLFLQLPKTSKIGIFSPFETLIRTINQESQVHALDLKLFRFWASSVEPFFVWKLSNIIHNSS